MCTPKSQNETFSKLHQSYGSLVAYYLAFQWLNKTIQSCLNFFSESSVFILVAQVGLSIVICVVVFVYAGCGGVNAVVVDAGCGGVNVVVYAGCGGVIIVVYAGCGGVNVVVVYAGCGGVNVVVYAGCGGVNVVVVYAGCGGVNVVVYAG